MMLEKKRELRDTFNTEKQAINVESDNFNTIPLKAALRKALLLMGGSHRIVKEPD